jgi:chromosome segregation ATPase
VQQLGHEKKELILAQLTFDQRLSEQTEKVDALQEKVDRKAQKVNALKLEMEALKEAQNDKDTNQARLREEIDSY